MKINEMLNEHIVKVKGGYRLLSHEGKNLGTFPSKSAAEKHEREVQYFKHVDEAAMNPSAYQQSLETGQERGVKVGFEFEVLIPSNKVSRYRSGDEDEYGDDDDDSYSGGSSDYEHGAEFLKSNLRSDFGNDMVIFNSYHQATKKLDRWYIEPDCSLEPDRGDYAAEIVSPPMPAKEAMSALKTFYSRAKEMDLYTNSSTGLHINVSIPDDLDILKLIAFSGDERVLQQFGRSNSTYAKSVLKSLKNNSGLPNVSEVSMSTAMKDMTKIARQITDNHFSSINYNGNYVSFRHAGGDYLSNLKEIYDTVGRFIRAMVIASDPSAYRNEYIKKLTKLMTPAESPRVALRRQTTKLILSAKTNGVPVMMVDSWLMDDNLRNEPLLNDAVRSRFNHIRGVEVIPYDIPGIKERMIADTGFMMSTKNKLREGDPASFNSFLILPGSIESLEQMNIQMSNSTGRSKAIGFFYDENRIAIGITEFKLIKPQDPMFNEIFGALRSSVSRLGSPSRANEGSRSSRRSHILQGIEEQDVAEAKRKRKGKRKSKSNPNRSPVPRYTGWFGFSGEEFGDGGGIEEDSFDGVGQSTKMVTSGP